MGKPLAIDLYCGLGGWTEGLLTEGYRVVGFDIERHDYGTGGYPAQLVLQDVLTLHGAQFKDAALIVASPPCQAYSYRAMPWKRAKALPPPDNALFEACFRIQREASEAAGRHIPLVVENVKGAQKWVGRARWHFGSFYLWGDVPALMPIAKKAIKVSTMGAGWYPPGHPKHVAGLAFNGHAERNLRAATNGGLNDTDGRRASTDAEGSSLRPTEATVAGAREGVAHSSGSHHSISEFASAMPGGNHTDIVESMKATKNAGGSWFAVAHNTTSGHGQNPDGRLDDRALRGRNASPGGKDGWFGDYQSLKDGIKQHGSGREWFAGDGKISRLTSSDSPARKAASAHIAKIPPVLAQHIARAWKPC